MKISHVSPRYYPDFGGVESNVKEVCERLAKKDFEVEVLTTDPTGELVKEEIVNGVSVKRFRSWAPNDAYCFSNELRRYLKKNSNNYDIVHAHSYHAIPALYAAQTKNKNKFFFNPHYHGSGHTYLRSLLHVPYKLLGKRIFQKADRIICVSHYEKSLISKDFNIREEKVAVIPNGVNSQEFRSLRKREKNHRAVLSVGRLEKYKGLQHLIRVLKRLNNDVVLEIVGKGPYKETLVELSKKLGVYDRVRFSQDLPRTKLLQKYADADVFVLLSKYEAYGISVAEALASRTPCIVANTSALREWVDGKNCFGIEYPINYHELQDLINKVMGRQVKELKPPTWDEVTAKLINQYWEIGD